MKIEKIKADPPFDLMFYMSVSGSKRLEQKLLEGLESKWKKWKGLLRAYRLTPDVPPAGAQPTDGYLLAWLDKDVEDEIERIYQNDPIDGMPFHNLAICVVMGVARTLVHQVGEGACAPLPEPDEEMLAAFKSLGLEWNPAGRVDRQFAVLTPLPYRDGCPICYMKNSCPNSTVR